MHRGDQVNWCSVEQELARMYGEKTIISLAGAVLHAPDRISMILSQRQGMGMDVGWPRERQAG